ncbi:hypothetical protein C8R43DRAFT_962573 [Mycena crocata]|nr:hypothetical protein C8R43DRAFT_962573 [Mycena crocata]
MSPTPARQLFKEFAICATLSFLIILGLIHALLHLLHIYLLSGVALRSPLAKFLVGPAIQISQISQVHEYLLVVFKITLACSILVFATREIMLIVGSHLGYWQKEADVETGKQALPFCHEPSWIDEKNPLQRDSDYPVMAAAAPDDELLMSL